MAYKLRSVNTHFWDDSYVVNLDPIEKLLFLYFLTNPLTNLTGLYEISLRRIAFDTGIDRDMVQKIIERFEKDKKLYYRDGYIIIVNFIKNQRINPKMKINIENTFEEIPTSIKEFLSSLSIGFDRLSIAYAYPSIKKKKEEVRSKKEEVRSKKEEVIPELSEFLDYARELQIYDPSFDFQIEAKYNSWKENKWRDGYDKKITNWKTKLQNTIPHFKKDFKAAEVPKSTFRDFNKFN